MKTVSSARRKEETHPGQVTSPSRDTHTPLTLTLTPSGNFRVFSWREHAFLWIVGGNRSLSPPCCEATVQKLISSVATLVVNDCNSPGFILFSSFVIFYNWDLIIAIESSDSLAITLLMLHKCEFHVVHRYHGVYPHHLRNKGKEKLFPLHHSPFSISAQLLTTPASWRCVRGWAGSPGSRPRSSPSIAKVGHRRACRCTPLLLGTPAPHPPAAPWADTSSSPTPPGTSWLQDTTHVGLLNQLQELEMRDMITSTAPTCGVSLFWSVHTLQDT